MIGRRSDNPPLFVLRYALLPYASVAIMLRDE